FLQPLHDCCETGDSFRSVCGECIKYADGPHALALLRARRERPRRRAAEQRDELAPLHSITSSARASSVGGTSSTLAANRATRRTFPASLTNPVVSVVGRNGLGLGRGLDI